MVTSGCQCTKQRAADSFFGGLERLGRDFGSGLAVAARFIGVRPRDVFPDMGKAG